MENITFFIHFFICLVTAPVHINQFDINVQINESTKKTEIFQVIRKNPNLFEVKIMDSTAIFEINGTQVSVKDKKTDQYVMKADVSDYLVLSPKTDFQKIKIVNFIKKKGITQGFYTISRQPYQILYEFKSPNKTDNGKFSISYKTKTQISDKKSIDTIKCAYEFNSFGFGLGSMRYEVVGKSKHGCVILYGIEIENPRYDGFLQNLCVLPETLGVFEFDVKSNGPDLNTIKQYCTETPKVLRKEKNSQ